MGKAEDQEGAGKKRYENDNQGARGTIKTTEGGRNTRGQGGGRVSGRLRGGTNTSGGQESMGGGGGVVEKLPDGGQNGNVKEAGKNQEKGTTSSDSNFDALRYLAEGKRGAENGGGP